MSKTKNLKGGKLGNPRYDRITISLQEGYGQRLKDYARSRNMTVTALLERYIRRILPEDVK